MIRQKRRLKVTAFLLSLLLLWTQVAWAAYGSIFPPGYQIYHPLDPSLNLGNVNNYNGYLYYTGQGQTVKVDIELFDWLQENSLSEAVISEVYTDLSEIGLSAHHLLTNVGNNTFNLEFSLPDLQGEAATCSLPIMVQVEGEEEPRLVGEYNLLVNYNFPADWVVAPDPATQTDSSLDNLSEFTISRPGIASLRWLAEDGLSLVQPDLIKNWQDWQRVRLEPKLAGYPADYLPYLPPRMEIVLENIYLAENTGDPDIVRLYEDGAGGWIASAALDATEFPLAPGWDENTRQVNFIVNQPGLYAFPPCLQLSEPAGEQIELTEPGSTIQVAGQVQDLEAEVAIYLDDENVLRATPALNSDGTFAVELDLGDIAEGEHRLKILALSTNPALHEVIEKELLVDYTPPQVTGVAEGQTYSTPVTIVFNEGSGYLNGEIISSGTTVFSNGSYTLEVVDRVGHRTVLHFSISISSSGSSEPLFPSGFTVPQELQSGLSIRAEAAQGDEPGQNAGIWEIEYAGSLSQPAAITFPIQTQLQDGQGAGVWYYSPLANRWLPLGGQIGADRQTITASLTHFSRYGVFLRPNSFPDLPAQHWAAVTISRWAGQGRIQGNQGKFEPERTITRAELASLLIRVRAVEDDGRSLPLPADVPASHWAARDIALVVNKGWLLGYNNRFRPQDAVTREELAVVLARLADLGASADLSSFSDNSLISPWARQAIGQAVKQGIMNGRGQNSLAARAAATRAEAVTMLYRWNQKFGLNE